MDTLTSEQQSLFTALENGHSVYLRGDAGTGKTYTLQCLHEWAILHHKKVHLSAMTGCAAQLFQGTTVHSFLGIGLASKTAEELAQWVLTRKRKLVKQLKQVDIWVIDEISMMDKILFETISEFLKILRKNPKAFGDIQLVLCGDFAQLPPVKGTYCFMSPLWNELQLTHIHLTESFRHDSDPSFQQLLTGIRSGKITQKQYQQLESLKSTTFPYGIQPTRLYPLCSNIEEINQHYLKKLIKKGHPSQTYERSISQQALPIWIQSLQIPDCMTLCVNAQVYVTHNISIESGLVNGTRGIIKEVYSKSIVLQTLEGNLHTIGYHSLFHEDNEEVSVCFMPIRLAFALTIHKSQGMTLDAIELDLGENIFEYGQAYTALSRAKSLSGIRIVDLNLKAFKTHPSVRQFYKELNIS